MQEFCVKGMRCAACSARVEKAVGSLPGVDECTVSLLTNSMSVEGSETADSIIAAVVKAGYKASVKKSGSMEETDGHESVKILIRLVVSAVLTVILMYFSMGVTMANFPVPAFLMNDPKWIAVIQGVLALSVMIINGAFFVSGFKGVIHLAPNMDTLVSMGSAASYIYSLVITVLMFMGHSKFAGMHGLHELYFESAAMILTLITVGKLLEAKAKGKTGDAVRSLMKLAPKKAYLIKKNDDGTETEIETDIIKVQIGDIFAVKPGGTVPVDGIVTDGNSAVNEAMLTGESIPVDKTKGMTVSAATLNTTGYLKCRATRVGKDTTFSQILEMMNKAAATKAPISKTADKVAGIFVPAVILIAIVTFLIWFFTGHTIGFSLTRAISVLVISCPCALGLATPVAIMVGNGVGAKHGILFKTAESMENTGKVKIIALDKTGTITNGMPKVTDVIPLEGDENELISVAYSLEKKSEHTLAKAVTVYAEKNGVKALDTKEFKALSGSGVEALYNGVLIRGGNENFISSYADTKNARSKIDLLSDEGKTPMLFSKGDVLLGIIAVQDVIKDDAAEVIEGLKRQGIRTVMLTGDNRRTAESIAKAAGVDSVIPELKPDEKASAIEKLKKEGMTAMVGDGINDAPALMCADIGIAVGNGTDVAIDSASVVIVNGKMSELLKAIRVGKITLRIIKENLFWAFIYNIIGIPLAAGLWIPIFGWTLNPMFGAAAMSLSSFCVVMNALRINLKKI